MLLRALAAIAWLLLATVPAWAADGDRRVLILNSYHRGFDWSDDEEEGIFRRLRAVFPSIDIPVVYLDSKRFPGEEHQEQMRDFLATRYGGVKIDLVFALDNPALDLLTRHPDTLFPGIPVVFAGISDYGQYMESGRGKITGVVERQDVRNTLETALSFHPEAKEVLILNDTTVSGVSARREAEAAAPRFSGRVHIRFLPPSTFDEARTAIGALPPEAIVLVQSFSTDRAGKTLSGPDSTRLFVSAAKVPVYTMHESRFVPGVVGGFLLDGGKHGRAAADLALRVLMGMDPSEVPVEDASTSLPTFDHAQLARFGISMDKLPPGSVLVNKPATVFETHRKFAVGTLLAVLFLSLLVGLLAAGLLRLKRTEEALRLTQYCLDKSPIAFCTINEDAKIETVNESMCRHLGYTPEEFAGMTVYDIDPNFTPEKFREHRKKLYAAGFRTIETVHRRKDGTEFPVEVTAKHLKYKGRDVTYSFAKDISERKAAEREQAGLKEQLFQSQKMETVGLLAGGVAHDFNNLLMPILGYSEMMMARLPEGHPDRQKLEQIHRAADLAKALTMRLLAFSRKQVLRLDAVDVGGIVRGLEPVLRRTIRENIRIETVVGDKPATARADKGQIEQALLNLAVNAQDAMPEGGTLTIEAGDVDLDESGAAARPETAPGSYVRLAVSDTGTGMDEETQAHIFEPFFTTKEKGKGTGLGLATVYGIVKQHGGTVSVRSGVGRGSVFEILLPRIPAAAKEEAAPPPPAAGEVERGTGTVLVAEDNETVRTLACGMLKDLGYGCWPRSPRTVASRRPPPTKAPSTCC
jgi:PAS domain S-box-containing protein